jgi:hypothetical protein
MEPYDPRWSQLGRALGLALHEPVGTYDGLLTFKGLKRRAGPPTPRETGREWLYGRRAVARSGAVDVIVARWHPIVGTSFVARIDPPLFLGLRATRNEARWFH